MPCVTIDFLWILGQTCHYIVKWISALCTYLVKKGAQEISPSHLCVNEQTGKCSCVWLFTLSALGLGLLWGSEAQWFAQRARPEHADGLDMHNVICLLFQVP